MASAVDKLNRAADKTTTKLLSAELKVQRASVFAQQKITRRVETGQLNHAIKYKRTPEHKEFMNIRDEAIKRAHRRGVTDDELKLCGVDVVRMSNGPEIDRASAALMEVHKGNLKYSDIDIFFNDKLTEAQQNTIFRAITSAAGNRDTIDEIARIAKPQYTTKEMDMAISKIAKGRSHDEIDTIFLVSDLMETSFFDKEQKKAIQFGFDEGLDKHQIMRIARPELDADQMREIIRGYQKGLSEKEIALYGSPAFSAKQMTMLRYALVHDVPYDEVKKFAKPSIPAEEMREKALAAVDYAKKHPIKTNVSNLNKDKANLAKEEPLVAPAR